MEHWNHALLPPPPPVEQALELHEDQAPPIVEHGRRMDMEYTHRQMIWSLEGRVQELEEEVRGLTSTLDQLLERLGERVGIITERSVTQRC